ncbi:hypothetical protein C8Q76DRAFT_721163 [Earliella scabrosa]|nr:hypothetical protein C8Q76DRAFT_721163 [Earliella scabrosa]
MSTEKLSRKHRKPKETSDPAQDERPSKSKKAKPDEPTDDPAADPNGAEQIGTQAREKKHKKRKHVERDDVPLAGVDVEEPKKKRKKRRHDEGTGDAEDPVAHGGVGVVNGEEADEKKKRKKRAKVLDDSAEVAVDTKVKKAKRRHADGEAETAEEGVSVPPQPADGSKEDKKKKEKKKKHKGDGNAEEAEGDAPKTTEADGNGKHKKKRKHRPSSGLPDPSEDESLTDQARKALQYAFLQFDDPSSWKFNKARQNWLIRNVWSDEAVPESYVPLVERYLQGIQGGARETLVKSCREAIQPTPPTADEEPVTGQGDTRAPSEPSKGENESPTKRTVKFAVEEPSSEPDPKDEIKRRRAMALLAVLTSS